MGAALVALVDGLLQMSFLEDRGLGMCRPWEGREYCYRLLNKLITYTYDKV